MSLRFRNLGSGSGGNATVVEASQGITRTQMLVDCGFGQRELARRLAVAGTSADELDAVFITHEHGDHVGCALALCSRFRIPLFTSRGTWRAVGNDAFDATLLQLCRDGDHVECGDLAIEPFAVPHDALEPLQLTLSDGGVRLGVVTDLGSFTAAIADRLKDCEALLLECNHDEEMLRCSDYHRSLKQRILGSHGHLSNESAAALLSASVHPRLRHVVAAHLSQQNNRPELAQAALASVLGCESSAVTVASQRDGFDWLDV